ncbi:GNAT family N-acetyltransferase [Kitasatospora sp. NPDC054795]
MIRPLRTPADYPALARLLAVTTDALAGEDAALPSTDALTAGPDGRLIGHGRIRLLAEDRAGRAVGYATAWRAPWTPPGDIASYITADSPDLHLALVDALAGWARTVGAARLLSELPDSGLHLLPSLLDRGHTVDAHIRSATTALHPSAGPLPAAPPGVRLTTLATTTAPDPVRQLHALYLATLPDNPGHADALPDYDQWHTETLTGAAHRPDWIHLAEHQDRLVAVTAAHATPDPRTCHLTYTAVARPWRHRGLARTLKLHAHHHLAQAGLRTARTEVAAANTAMTTLNTTLGYAWHPGHHRLVLPL